MALFGLFKNKKKSQAKVETKSEPKIEIKEEFKTNSSDIALPNNEAYSIDNSKEVKKEATVKADDLKVIEHIDSKPKKSSDIKQTNVSFAKKETKSAPKTDVKCDSKIADKKQINNDNIEIQTEKEVKVWASKSGRFEINKSKDGKKFFFNLYASNSVGIATSQMYSSSQSALNGVKSVIANAEKAPIEDKTLKNYTELPYPKWEIYLDNGGKYRFRLNASNGSCVCHSQGYTTKAACKNGIDSIIRSSKNAEIDKTYIKND